MSSIVESRHASMSRNRGQRKTAASFEGKYETDELELMGKSSTSQSRMYGVYINCASVPSHNEMRMSLWLIRDPDENIDDLQVTLAFISFESRRQHTHLLNDVPIPELAEARDLGGMILEYTHGVDPQAIRLQRIITPCDQVFWIESQQPAEGGARTQFGFRLQTVDYGQGQDTVDIYIPWRHAHASGEHKKYLIRVFNTLQTTITSLKRALRTRMETVFGTHGELELFPNCVSAIHRRTRLRHLRGYDPDEVVIGLFDVANPNNLFPLSVGLLGDRVMFIDIDPPPDEDCILELKHGEYVVERRVVPEGKAPENTPPKPFRVHDHFQLTADTRIEVRRDGVTQAPCLCFILGPHVERIPMIMFLDSHSCFLVYQRIAAILLHLRVPKLTALRQAFSDGQRQSHTESYSLAPTPPTSSSSSSSSAGWVLEAEYTLGVSYVVSTTTQWQTIWTHADDPKSKWARIRTLKLVTRRNAYKHLEFNQSYIIAELDHKDNSSSSSSSSSSAVTYRELAPHQQHHLAPEPSNSIIINVSPYASHFPIVSRLERFKPSSNSGIQRFFIGIEHGAQYDNPAHVLYEHWGFQTEASDNPRAQEQFDRFYKAVKNAVFRHCEYDKEGCITVPNPSSYRLPHYERSVATRYERIGADTNTYNRGPFIVVYTENDELIPLQHNREDSLVPRTPLDIFTFIRDNDDGTFTFVFANKTKNEDKEQKEPFQLIKDTYWCNPDLRNALTAIAARQRTLQAPMLLEIPIDAVSEFVLKYDDGWQLPTVKWPPNERGAIIPYLQMYIMTDAEQRVLVICHGTAPNPLPIAIMEIEQILPHLKRNIPDEDLEKCELLISKKMRIDFINSEAADTFLHTLKHKYADVDSD